MSPYGSFPICSGCQGRKCCTKLPDTDRSCGCFHGCLMCVSWLQPWAEQAAGKESPSSDLNPRISGEPCTLCGHGNCACRAWGWEPSPATPGMSWMWAWKSSSSNLIEHSHLKYHPLPFWGHWIILSENVSSASQVGCECEQIVLAFPLLHLVAMQGCLVLSCAAFCSQGELALRDTGMSALLARWSVSCIIGEKTEVSHSVRATRGQRNLRFSIRSFGVWFFFPLYQFYNNNNINNNTNKNNCPESSHVRWQCEIKIFQTRYCPPNWGLDIPCFLGCRQLQRSFRGKK